MTNPSQSRHLNSHFRRGSGKQAHSERNRQIPTETTLRDEPAWLPWTSFRPERADFFFLVRSCYPGWLCGANESARVVEESLFDIRQVSVDQPAVALGLAP